MNADKHSLTVFFTASREICLHILGWLVIMLAWAGLVDLELEEPNG